MSKKIWRLMSLSDAEYTRKRTTPTRQRFKPVKVDLLKLNPEWDRERGAAARMTAVILGHDSDSLLQTVSADAETAATFADAVAWLEKEARTLRKIAGRHEVAVTRLTSALCRYKASQHAAPSASSAEASAP